MRHSSDLLTSAQLLSSENSSSQTVGWKQLKFGDVCKVQGGFAFKSHEYQKNGIPLVRISNLVNGKVSFDSDTVYLPAGKLEVHKDFIVKRGDTLIAMSGATTGKMATFDLDSPALLNQRVGRFRILSGDTCNPRFISFLVQQITRQVLKEAYGAAQPNISPTQIEQIPIPFPPLEEQNAIVSEIEKQFTRLEAGVTGLRRVQANLKRYRATVLKAACEGKLVPTEAKLARQEGRSYETGAQLLERILSERREKWSGKGKYQEPEKPDIANLPPLPEGWTWASLDQLQKLLRNGISKKPDAEIGLPILRISAVRMLSVNLSDTRYLKAQVNDYAEFCLSEGDLLFTRYNGNPDLVGVCGVVPGLSSHLVHPDKLIRCKLASDDLLPKFVGIMANIGASREFLAKRVRTTAGQAGISGGDLKVLPIPVAPLTEQQRIVAEVERRLSVVEELEAVVNANLQRATRFRQSILQRAFSGELLCCSN